MIHSENIWRRYRDFNYRSNLYRALFSIGAVVQKRMGDEMDEDDEKVYSGLLEE